MAAATDTAVPPGLRGGGSGPTMSNGGSGLMGSAKFVTADGYELRRASSGASSLESVAASAAAGDASRRPRHPRLAVLLGVDQRWYVPLQLGRGLSTAPAAWWGLRCFVTFVADLVHELSDGRSVAVWDVERQFRITEMLLAVLWCVASAYLSFFFTDCLMSRWLVHYTPQATLVRLFTTSCANAYLTSWVLMLSGGNQDPRLLLPAWISIASILTVCYHVTQRKINIRRETSASLSVFSIASTISMVSLILQLHLAREDTPSVPLLTFTQRILSTATAVILKFVGPVGRDL